MASFSNTNGKKKMDERKIKNISSIKYDFKINFN